MVVWYQTETRAPSRTLEMGVVGATASVAIGAFASCLSAILWFLSEMAGTLSVYTFGTCIGFIIGATLVAAARGSLNRAEAEAERKARERARKGSVDGRPPPLPIPQEVLSTALLHLPKWTKDPDCSRAAWLNNVLEVLWPYVDTSVSEVIRDSIEPLLRTLVPPIVSWIGFEKITLGPTPPTIGGVKVLGSNSEEVMLELEVNLASGADAVLAAEDCTGGLTTVEHNTTVFADGVLSFGWEDTSYGASVAYANADGNATTTDASVINPAGALRFTAAEGTFGAGATLRISLTDSAQDSANAASVAEFVLGFESVRDPTGTATYRVPLIQLVDLAGFEDDETLDLTFTADPTKVPEDAAFDSVTIIHSAGAASGGAAAAVVIDAMTLAVPKNYSTPSCPAGTPEALPVAAELTFVAEDLSLDDSQLTCISTVAQTCAAALYEVPAIAVQATAAQTAADAFTVRLYVEPAPFVPLPSVSEEQLSECATAPAASCVPALSAESSSSTTAVVFVPTEQSEALLSFDPQPVLRFALDECGPYNTLSVDGAVQNAGSSATQLSGVATGVDAGALVVCDAASDGSACAAGAPGVSPPGPMVFNPTVEAASAKAIGNPTSGGAIVADAIPQELLDTKAMSVLVWARLDAINGEVAPVVSTYAPTADGESDTGVVVGCFQAGPYGGCEWGVKVSMTGGLEGAYTLLSGVEGVVRYSSVFVPRS